MTEGNVTTSAGGALRVVRSDEAGSVSLSPPEFEPARDELTTTDDPEARSEIARGSSDLGPSLRMAR